LKLAYHFILTLVPALPFSPYLCCRTGYAVRNRHSYLVKNFERGVRPQVPAEHFAYAPPKTRDVVTQRGPLDVPAIPASAPVRRSCELKGRNCRKCHHRPSTCSLQ
jgi:hypothetical protein